MTKQLSIALFVIVAILIGTVLYVKRKRFIVVITQDQIDESLTKIFPMAKKHLRIFEIVYSDPEVVFLETDDRIQVSLNATLKLRFSGEPKNLGGSCTITSGVRYDPETQSIFLADAQIDRLEIQGIPEKYLARVAKFAETAAKEFVESKPVYQLQAKDAKTAAAKRLLRGFEVRDQAIHVTLGI